MEFEQIVKRLDFLDKQQRENKEALARLSERLNSFESSVNVVSKQIKTLSNTNIQQIFFWSGFKFLSVYIYFTHVKPFSRDTFVR